ncbi:hypothetical protein C2G38_2090266 [Gigaspora rosea]|uniref:Uncharacterized protein n=1 Tax=Gigaspora rosea TaxID=44941 RepID=A0A397VBK3_9GLOM|nr:hypothetical protein C2G38_2090266 [Gigaspora rosea]
MKSAWCYWKVHPLMIFLRLISMTQIFQCSVLAKCIFKFFPLLTEYYYNRDSKKSTYFSCKVHSLTRLKFSIYIYFMKYTRSKHSFDPQSYASCFREFFQKILTLKEICLAQNIHLLPFQILKIIIALH